MSQVTPARVNDFSIKIATVNGTGSASANTLLMKSIFRSGIPVMGKNYFPSNIQGLPTWYEVRVTEAGHLGRRGGTDMMVAMNPQTWDADVAELEPGGYLFYDSTRALPPSKFRDDIRVIGMPLTEICNAVGFSSVGSFSYLFARRMGVAPSAYRQSARSLVQVPGILPPQLYPGCFSLLAYWPAS